MNLQGRVALVTGGGRRLGRGISEALASAGCNLLLHFGQSREKAESAAVELAALGVEVTCVGADLAEVAQIDTLFTRVREQCGGLDILVNSAASFHRRSLTEMEPQVWDEVMAVNLRAPALCIQRAAPLMRSTPRPDSSPGAIINIADLSGVMPWPGYTPHGVSKAGLLHLTRIAARELAPEVRVNAVIPGPVLPPPGESSDSEEWRKLARRLPAGRSGRVADVGAAVVFLAQNDFVFGETLFIDGGEHLLGAGHRQM
jgi:pteridine reductase